jgi:predicted kinase
MKGKLTFLIGLPRSGKSTVANRLAQDNTNTVIVCADNIRIALHGCRWSTVAEPMVKSIKEIMIRSCLDRGQNVIVDGTHTTPNSIKEMFRLDPDATYLLIDTSAKKCKERATKSNMEDLHPVIDRMSNQLLELTPDLIEQIRQEVKNNPIIPRISIC